MASKKQKEFVENAVTDVLKKVGDAVKDASDEVKGKMKSPVIKNLEDLAALYATVDVKIKKKNPKNNSFAHFITLERKNTADLLSEDLDQLCEYEGGGGEYQVFVKDPNMKSWASSIKYEGIQVMGRSYDIARTKREAMGLEVAGNGNGVGSLPGYSFPGTGFGNTGGGKTIETILRQTNDQMKQQAETATQTTDRFMMMMQKSSETQMQMMTALMAGMMGNKNNDQSSAANAELQVLKEKIRQMEQEKRQDEKFSMLARELAETKQQLLMTQNKGGDRRDDLLVALLQGNQTSQAQATSNYLELFRTMMERPSEDEKVSGLMNTAARMMQANMELISNAVQQNLIGGGSSHPVAEIISQAVEGFTQVATTALEARQAQQEYTGPAEVVPPPAPYPNTELGHIPPAPQLAEHQSVAPQAAPSVPPVDPEPVQEDESEDPEKQLSDDDISIITRDTALNQILAKIQNGIDITEVTARIYSHFRSGNGLSRRWFQYPEEMTEQILTYFQMPDRIDELVANIHAFTEFMYKSGDPNKWAKTGYQVIKTVAANPSIPPSMDAEAPEFGRIKGKPKVGEEYDSANPPHKSSINPEPIVESASQEEEIQQEVGEAPEVSTEVLEKEATPEAPQPTA